MTLLQKLKLFYLIIRGAMNTDDVSFSLRVGDLFREADTFRESIETIKVYPGGEVLFEARPFNFNQNIEFFSQCPPQSLGRAYYDHLIENRLNPEDLLEIEVKDDTTYLENLIRQVHDVWHVVTDFDTSIAGEIGLQAFKAKQMNWPFAMVAIGGACFVTLLKEPQNIIHFIDQIGRGYNMATKARPLILVDWDRYWDRPLIEVKRELGFDVPQAKVSPYSELSH